MVVDYLPPLPVSRNRALNIAKKMAFIGYQYTRMKPAIIAELAQAEITTPAEHYIAVSLLSALYQGGMVFGALLFTMYYFNMWGFALGAAGLSLLVAGFGFMRSVVYPSYVVKRRVNEIEKNFLYALRHLLIQVRGGTPVFNSLVSVSEAGYGAISDEFMRVVKEINSGRPMTEALERMALRNPSIYLRRMTWQIVNALRTGSDMGKTLQVILEQFTDEQRVLLQKFSKELAPWAMMYMMVTVVFPTLGITLFLILSSLSSVQLSEPVLMAFVLVSIIIQYFFIQFLKTKRPSMRW